MIGVAVGPPIILLGLVLLFFDAARTAGLKVAGVGVLVTLLVIPSALLDKVEATEARAD